MSNMSKETMFKVGDILRTGIGPTALMEITYISKNHGSSIARYYGQHCMGGLCGAYHERVQVADDPRDVKTWEANKRWRRPVQEFMIDRGIVSAVEGG